MAYLQCKPNLSADALFNVPAFLTAQLWKAANSYLYSFEHAGNMPRGDTFLKGLLLIGNGSQSKKHTIIYLQI